MGGAEFGEGLRPLAGQWDPGARGGDGAVRRIVLEDLAVCGFGDADFAANMHPSLTTVHVDGEAIGKLAAQLIVDRCHGKAAAQPIVDVGFRIIERQSTARAAR